LLLFFPRWYQLVNFQNIFHNRSEELDRAIDHLKKFVELYPPNDIRVPTPKIRLRSTRTSLEGSRPLVRMTSETEVPDDHVPPLIVFRDVALLHDRLLDAGREKDIDFLTWLCKSYECGLRMRKDASVKARPGVPGDELEDDRDRDVDVD
jgi:hypothetical protein